MVERHERGGGGGRLTIDPVGPGTATVTATATDPATGYVATYEFEVTVAGSPWVEDLGFQQREGWNPRFTQTLRVRNDSGMEANGVRVLFSGLMPGIEVENQTGVSPDGRDMIEMRTAFAAGETLDLNVAYVCSGTYRVDEWPPAIEVQYVLPEWTPPLPGSGVAIEGIPLSGGRFLLQFASKPGNLYAIEYMNDFPAGEWVRVPLRLLATANQTQWIDSGPPATEPPSGLRAYRVKELAP